MVGGLRTRELVVLGSALAAGLVGSAVALSSTRGSSGFVYEQRNPAQLRPAEVERVVRTAPHPAVGRGEGDSARCRAGGRRGLRNPWTCVVRYGSGREARLTVRINEDGSYAGRYAGGGRVTGCCIEIPGAG